MTTEPKKKKRKPSAFADVMRQWESLLSAVADHGSEVPIAEPYRAALAGTLERARATKDLQESHAANRQAATQSLQEILVEGKDQAIRLRGVIRGGLGPTTEQLKQFGIQPIRRRPLRHKSGTPTPAPAIQPTLQPASAVRE